MQPVEKAIRAFPKLYYFVSPIEPFEIDVPPKNVKSLAKRLGIKPSMARKIQIKKPLDTILWLIDTSCSERAFAKKGYCSQIRIEHLVSRWTNVNLNKELAKLYAAELIDGRDDADNRKKRELRLSPKGDQVLNTIKGQRREIIKMLFDKDKLSQRQMNNIAKSIEIIASATWPIMNHTEDVS